MTLPKLAVFVNGFRPPWTEAGKKNVAELAARLETRFRLVFLGLDEEDGPREYRGHPVHGVASPGYTRRWARLGYPAGSLRLLARAARILRLERPDVLLCAMETASAGALALAIRKLARLPSEPPLFKWLWTDWYELGPGRRHWLTEQLPHLLMNGEALARAVLRRADAVICASRYLERRAAAAGAKAVLYAPSGVDLERYRPRPELRRAYAERLVVAYVGHMTFTKGTSLLIRAIEPLLARGAARLLIAAAGETEESALLERLRGHPRVTVFGVVDPAEVFGASDVTVLPRRFSYGTASYPNVLVESLASGTPVLTSRLPAVDEIVRDGDNGLLLPPGDLGALEALLAHLAAEPERLLPLKARARASVEHLAWDRAAAPIADALEGACGLGQ